MKKLLCTLKCFGLVLGTVSLLISGIFLLSWGGTAVLDAYSNFILAHGVHSLGLRFAIILATFGVIIAGVITGIMIKEGYCCEDKNRGKKKGKGRKK